MIYNVEFTKPRYHKMSLQSLFFEDEPTAGGLIFNDPTSTTTRKYDQVTDRLYRKVELFRLINRLIEFNARYEHLRQEDRESLYESFKIPKKKGGWRQIDAPKPELKLALYELKSFLEDDCHCLYHTSAFAYIKGRSTVDSVKKHQLNESNWFAKFDMKNFFPSTTLDFVMQQCSMVFPLSEICRDQVGYRELRKALELGFLHGGLPQGTPLSPTITNIMMIPIDFELTKKFKNVVVDHDGKLFDTAFVYTRYADDILVSSKYTFNVREIEEIINNVLAEFHAPFMINQEKTRYGSRAGSNWNLGVMLNKDNEITIGWRAKKRLKAALSNYACDKLNSKKWSGEDLYTLQGYIAHYQSIEKDCINDIIGHLSSKYKFDILKEIKKDIGDITRA